MAASRPTRRSASAVPEVWSATRKLVQAFADYSCLLAQGLVIAAGPATPGTLTLSGLTVLLARHGRAPGHKDGKPPSSGRRSALPLDRRNRWLAPCEYVVILMV